MAVQDKVTIKVEVDVDGMGELTVLEERFKRLEKKSKKFSDRISESTKKINQTSDALDRTNQNLDAHDKRMNRVNHSHRRFARTLDRVTAPLKKFIVTLSKLSFIALIGQIGLFTVGLLSAKLALMTGRAAVQVYQVALKGLSVAAAGVATAVSVAAAALRQFNEAMLIPSVGGGMTQRGAQNAALLSRSLGSRTTGLLGGEASTALVAAFAKAGVSRTATAGMSRQLINLTGGDPAAVQALAKAIGSKDAAQLSAAISGAAGFRKDSLRSGMTTDQLLAALASGSVVSENYRGVGAGLAGTFIGTAKTEFSGMKNMFADIGQPLLNPFRDAMMDMARLLRENFLGMSLLIQRFGADSFAPTLVTLVEKTMDFIRSNIFDHLENIEQMGESFVGFFRSIRDFFHGIGAFLVQFEPAADVVIEMFRAMGATGGGRGLFRSFSDLIVKNAEAFQTFGASIGNVFGAIFDLLKSGQTGFFGKLDLFSEIMNTVAAKVIPAIGRLLETLVPVLEQLPTILSALAAVIEGITPVIGMLATVLSTIIRIPGIGGGLGALALFAMMKPGRALSMGKAIGRAPGKLAEKLGPYAGRAGLGAGGAILAGGGAYTVLSQGESATGAMGMIAGGAAIGTMFAPGAGTAIGAGLGALAAAITTFFGERSRQNRIDEMLDAAQTLSRTTSFTGTPIEQARARGQNFRRVRSAMGNLETDTMMVIDTGVFGKLRNEGNFFQKALFAGLAITTRGTGLGRETDIDPTGQNFMAMKKYAETYLGMDFSEFTRDDFTDQFSAGGRVAQIISEDIDKRTREAATMESNLESLRTATSLTEEVLEQLADTIGVDLYNATLNTAGAAAVFLAQTLPLMDRNRAFLPGFNTSALGQAELKATADAAFTTLGNADEITVDLVRDAVEAFAAFDIASGLSPDIGAFSAFAEIRERIFPALRNTDPNKISVLEDMMRAGTVEALTAMADKYQIPLETLLGFAGNDGSISTNLEVQNLERFLDQNDKLRRGLNLSSGMTGSERIATLRDQGFEVRSMENLKDQVLGAMVGDGSRSARVLFGNRSLDDVLIEAEKQGVNTASIVIRELASQGFLGDEQALSSMRNDYLNNIDKNIAAIAQNGLPSYADERGPIDDFSPELARTGGTTSLPGGGAGVSLPSITAIR